MKGVTVYPRIKEIVAEKPDGSLWRHKFTRRAAIIGKPDGSLAIQGADGQRLHKRFPYEGRSEPFLINPPRRRRIAKIDPRETPAGWSGTGGDFQKYLEKMTPRQYAAYRARIARAPRRNYHEEQEPRTAEIWKAPKHRAAALAGWLFRDRSAERKIRPRLGLAKKRRHGPQPRNLAQYHAREMRGRTQDPASRNPALPVPRAVAALRSQALRFMRERRSGRLSPGAIAREQEKLTGDIYKAGMQSYWGEIFAPVETRKRAAPARQSGLFAEGGRDQGLLFGNPPKREAMARDLSEVVYRQAREMGKSAKAARRMADTKYRHYLRQGSLGHSLKYRKNPLLQILNPPGGSKMRRSKKRMPAGLARYWASRRAAKKSRSNPAMAKRRRKAHTKRRRHSLVAANPRHRRHARRHARRHVRRNPPGMFRALNMDLLKDGAAVAGGIVLPQLALRVPQIEHFASTKLKRGLVKVGAALALSQLARRFVGPRAANLLLVGAAANLFLDALPTVAPKLGLGLADSYDPEQFPMLSEMGGVNLVHGSMEYGRNEALDEMPGSFS